MQQSTDTLLMIRPFRFRKNEQTAVNNFFQSLESANDHTHDLALAEFDSFVRDLTKHGIQTVVVQDEGKYDTPDSIFPNNIISFHQNTAVHYPMFAENRRLERQLNILGELQKQGFNFTKTIDYSSGESNGHFLEGTGVLVLDHIHRLAYCSLSPRAHKEALEAFCSDFGYRPIIFHAFQTVDDQREAIYHTNVMMSIGRQFCVICLDSIDNADERALVEQSLKDTNKTIITISEEQMNAFCGNILEVKNVSGAPFIVMSEQAFRSFSDMQKEQLSSFGQIIHSPLYTIEKYGGGSARCMIAEVFYSKA